MKKNDVYAFIALIRWDVFDVPGKSGAALKWNNNDKKEVCYREKGSPQIVANAARGKMRGRKGNLVKPRDILCH